MGWTRTTDPLASHRVAFHTADAAIAFAKRKGWDVRVVS
jgi:ETC complex I subunit-like protein